MGDWKAIKDSLRHPENPVVFFEMSAAGTSLGTFKVELFADVVPKTAENFRQLCTGEFRKDGVPIGYRNSCFHRVIKDFMVQGGDIVNGDGTGMMSIYGEHFPDECFELKHNAAGVLSMANAGKDTNGCQFFITCAPCDFLDGKHVVFGRVIDGMLTVRKIENAPVLPNSRPKLPIIITQCGQISTACFWTCSWIHVLAPVGNLKSEAAQRLELNVTWRISELRFCCS
uniref:Peptidyl-prolyl cis-trans isomerase n=1 Tax=Trichuris muris TaxID=70415 RepID=A0A5S6Q9Q5_TRIMR